MTKHKTYRHNGSNNKQLAINNRITVLEWIAVETIGILK